MLACPSVDRLIREKKKAAVKRYGNPNVTASIRAVSAHAAYPVNSFSLFFTMNL
ncbi:hypothetical protein [Bacillus paralicheniformis]|uniref:hypothetical protein n=1 Tax=Bacillus paralicheniformis TaxID=1648923 RepID=UPI003B980477